MSSASLSSVPGYKIIFLLVFTKVLNKRIRSKWIGKILHLKGRDASKGHPIRLLLGCNADVCLGVHWYLYRIQNTVNSNICSPLHSSLFRDLFQSGNSFGRRGIMHPYSQESSLMYLSSQTFMGLAIRESEII